MPDYTRAEPGPGSPDPRRPGPVGSGQDVPSRSGQPGPWPVPPAGSMVGRGPVRGYPPLPGQPPPLYPPGQFAAWNRHRNGQPRSAARRAGDGQDGPGPPGRAEPAADQAAQPAREAANRGAERYYAADADPGTDPGYSALAVSDPAADVTSTQTWLAVAEGRLTGIWTAPARLRGDAPGNAATSSDIAAPTADPAAGDPSGAGTVLPRRPARHSSRPLPRAPELLRTDTGPDPRLTTGPNPRLTTGPNPRLVTGPDRRVATGPSRGVSSGPQPLVSAAAKPTTDLAPTVAADDDAVASRTRATRRRRAGARARRAGRQHPASVKLAIAAALLLVLAAVGAMIYAVVHDDSTKPRLTSQQARKASPTTSPSQSLGPYGHIASRQTDPLPLTLAELYPASFTVDGVTVTNAATSLSADCAAELVGATLQSAVGAAGCTQVARATYVDVSGGLMATIGVLNLSTGAAATTAAQSADANDYISQLTAASGPAAKIGQGVGIEEALAKGHYLILVWAEFTNLKTPTAQQSAPIESFMTEVVHSTANVSLTNRMLTGTP